MNQLARHLEKFPSGPFLFIGSGLSRRFLDLPDWQGLLNHFAQLTNKPYEYYFSSAQGKLPEIASLIAKDFHDVWWQSEQYENNRELFKGDSREVSSALKIEISTFLRQRQNGSRTRVFDKEAARLKLANIDGIITTNWDEILETIFPDYKVFVGQNELLFSTTQGIGEIYKIHGSISNPNSLVLTAEDYANYNQRNPYLAAKLLTVFVEHPTLFLGYSVSDPNILSILGLVAESLTQENLSRLQDRLIIVTYNAANSHPKFDKTTIVVGEFRIPVWVYETKSFATVYDALQTFRRKFSARVLRQLKEHVYSLVLDNDPQGRLYVDDIDSEKHLKDADVVLGVGCKTLLADVGYTRIDRCAILEDLLTQDKGYSPDKIIANVLPDLVDATPYVPIYKYLSAANHDVSSVDVQIQGLDQGVLDAISHNLSLENLKPHLTRSQARLVRSCESAGELSKKTSLEEFVVLLPHVKIMPNELTLVKRRLSEVVQLVQVVGGKRKVPTNLGKAACYYDRVTFGPPIPKLR